MPLTRTQFLEAQTAVRRLAATAERIMLAQDVAAARSRLLADTKREAQAMRSQLGGRSGRRVGPTLSPS